MAAVLAAAAVAIWLGGDARLLRLHRLFPPVPSAPVPALAAGASPTAAPLPPASIAVAPVPVTLRAAAGLGGFAAVLLLPPPAAVVVAVALQGLLPWLVRRLQPRDTDAGLGDVALALDLAAAALQAGAVIPAALGAAGRALDGPVGDAFALAARAARLGGDPADRLVAALPGLPRAASAALRRALAAGTAAADPLRRAADELRDAAALAVEERLQSAAVRLVLPIGICFLPAFVLVGVVPVVAGFARLAF